MKQENLWQKTFIWSVILYYEDNAEAIEMQIRRRVSKTNWIQQKSNLKESDMVSEIRNW